MPRDIAGKRAWILGLTVDCPFSNPESGCIASKLRSVPLTEAYKQIQALPESELEQVLQCHKNCLVEREQELLSP